jgi:hypothetical protein
MDFFFLITKEGFRPEFFECRVYVGEKQLLEWNKRDTTSTKASPTRRNLGSESFLSNFKFFHRKNFLRIALVFKKIQKNV